ncbi:MAG: RNase P modulator RnpM [Burkholderiales bacterium]
MRMCIACRESRPKKELVRVVASEDGLFPDETGKAHGRGAYLCPNVECLDKAKKIKAFDRALETSMSEEAYSAIKRVILRRGLK